MKKQTKKLYKVETKAKCCNTFYGCNLQMFVIS